MLITAANLSESAALRHGFFTRCGGVSHGIYASLNCGLGSGDSPEHVRENRVRAAVMLEMDGHALVTGYQIHSADVVVVDEAWEETSRPHADGLVTRRRGVALGILTADCAPVLLADEDAGVIGAAHAGWRGARDGVVEATVCAMTALGASREAVRAAVGPCIGPCSYEVGHDFRDTFIGPAPATARFFHGGMDEAKPTFDLAAFVVDRLQAAGVRLVEHVAHDTYADAGRFFSYRRTVHAGEADYGRQLSAIALTG